MYVDASRCRMISGNGELTVSLMVLRHLITPAWLELLMLLLLLLSFQAIHGYRETERRNWYPHNKAVIQRVGDIAFNGQIMPFIHVLDLAEGGVIKPHVDSTRVSEFMIKFL